MYTENENLHREKCHREIDPTRKRNFSSADDMTKSLEETNVGYDESKVHVMQIRLTLWRYQVISLIATFSYAHMTISSDWGIEIRVLSNGTNKDSHSLTKTLIITKIWCFLAGFTRHIHTHMPNWAIVRLRWVTAEQSQLFNCLASVVGFQISWHLQVIHVVCRRRRHRHRMASSSVEPFCRAIDKTFFFSFFFVSFLHLPTFH